MANKTFFSPAMPFAMRPDDTNRPDRYHRGHLDVDWQKDLILPWQLDAKYLQPVELGDPFRYQVKSTANIGNKLYLVDCRGRIVHEFAITSAMSVPGDTTAEGTQYITYQYTYANLLTVISGGPVPEGEYYLKYMVDYDLSTSDMAFSEPIDIRASHPDTLLIEYTHSGYKEGIPFSHIPVRFRLRVQGFIESMVPKAISTVYQDQNSDTQTLDYESYETWRLYLGQTVRRDVEGVANWMLKKVNKILGFDSVLYDGKAFSPATGNPQWNVQGPISSPLKTADIEIQETVNNEDSTIGGTSFALYTTGTYPLALGHINIGGFPVTGAIRLADSTAENTAITAWNTGLPANELGGTISKVGSTVYYNNGPGEKYTFADVTKFTQKFSFGHTPPGTNGLTITLGNSSGVIAWGDGTAEEAIATAPTAFNHTYSTGIYTVEVWGGLESFAMNEADTSTLTGTMPAQLKSLSVQGMAFASNTFDFALLNNCRLSLTTLLMPGNGLTATSNMPSYNFPQLSTVQFSGNALTQTNMNNLIANVRNNALTNSIINGLLNVAVQVPPVTLNATGSSAKSWLQSMGWSVFN